MKKIWDNIAEVFTKTINFIKEPLLFTILLISLVGVVISSLCLEIFSLIVCAFFTFIIIKMIGE